MPFRRRMKRATLGKEPRIMGKSLLNTLLTNVPEISQLIVPSEFVSASGTDAILADADTKQICSPNSMCKYINIKFEISSDQETAPENPGWLEYCLVWFDEQKTAPTVDADITSNITTQTLPDICRNLFRGNCIWFDTFPVATGIPICPTVSIKIPTKFVKQKRGRGLAILSNFRSINAAEATSKCKVNYTTSWKCYL